MSEAPFFTVYVKPGCPWCTEALAYLDDHGYAYEAVDVIADPEAFAEMRELSGQSSAPTMTYGDLLLADFGAEELEAFLKKHQIEP
jgi:glutaredoxin